jgi:hypothetical protein
MDSDSVKSVPSVVHHFRAFRVFRVFRGSNSPSRLRAFAPSRLRVRPDVLASVASVSSVVPPFRAFRVFRGSILKQAFLEGCQRAGLFDAIAMEGAAP